MGTDITINVIHIMFSARLIAGVVPAMRNVGRARSLILMPTTSDDAAPSYGEGDQGEQGRKEESCFVAAAALVEAGWFGE